MRSDLSLFKNLSVLLLLFLTFSVLRGYFQHAYFISIVGVGKRGEY